MYRTKDEERKKEIDNRMIIIRKVYVYSRITIKSPLFTQRTVEYINTRWINVAARENENDRKSRWTKNVCRMREMDEDEDERSQVLVRNGFK